VKEKNAKKKKTNDDAVDALAKVQNAVADTDTIDALKNLGDPTLETTPKPKSKKLNSTEKITAGFTPRKKRAKR
jgi:hypothetical protein